MCSWGLTFSSSFSFSPPHLTAPPPISTDTSKPSLELHRNVHLTLLRDPYSPFFWLLLGKDGQSSIKAPAPLTCNSQTVKRREILSFHATARGMHPSYFLIPISGSRHKKKKSLQAASLPPLQFPHIPALFMRVAAGEKWRGIKILTPFPLSPSSSCAE